MRLFKFNLEDYDIEGGEMRCPECGWSTSVVYILGNSLEECREKMMNGEGLCGTCIADEIAMKDFKLYKRIS